MKSYIGPGTQWSDPYHTGCPTPYEQIDDGRWHHKISQSWAKTFDLCPERARLEHEGYSRETDAACVGTAVHSGIEYALGLWHAGEVVHHDEVLEVAHRELDGLEYEHVKWATDKAPHDFLQVCVLNFLRDVLPTLPASAELERRFLLPLIDTPEREVMVSGTIDYVPAVVGDTLRDWKTSGRGAYETWEYKRWDLQSMFYTWAAHELSLVHLVDGLIPFEFVVLGRHGVQRFDVHRGPNEWSWMRDKVTAMCKMIEAGLDEWPKQDNHALCSEKWCDAWAVCKGAHIN